MLGRELAVSTPVDVDLVACTHAELDITDRTALERTIRDAEPGVIVNAAAYTAVDKAEAERSLAFRVNGDAVGVIGQLAARAGALVAHYSTDYVFDGASSRPYREDDPVNPINAYGASKLAGERALQASGARFLVLRTSWLFGLHGRSFPRTMWERARAGVATRVVSDQWGRPTYTLDLAAATWELLRRGPTGPFHIANAGQTTWYEIARVVFASLRVQDLLTPCRTTDYPTPARRPAWSVLDLSRVEHALGRPLPPWEDALRRFFAILEPE